jgi:hypothetical protein
LVLFGLWLHARVPSRVSFTLNDFAIVDVLVVFLELHDQLHCLFKFFLVLAQNFAKFFAFVTPLLAAFLKNSLRYKDD